VELCDETSARILQVVVQTVQLQLSATRRQLIVQKKGPMVMNNTGYLFWSLWALGSFIAWQWFMHVCQADVEWTLLRTGTVRSSSFLRLVASSLFIISSLSSE